jgi:hypothetical protein
MATGAPGRGAGRRGAGRYGPGRWGHPRWRDPRWRATAGGVGAVIAALMVWLAWPSPPGVPGADRVRQYLAFSACLLTGARGISGGDAAAAWSGLQQASLATRAMVSYLPVFGPATRATAAPYLASLAQRHCRVIVAVGPAQVSAVAASSAQFRDIQFIVVAGRASGANVRHVAGHSAVTIRAAVSAAVSVAAAQEPAS